MKALGLNSGERAWRFAALAPSGLVYLFLFVAPFSVFFVISFWRVRSFRLRPDFIFDNYVAAVGDYYSVLGFTFAIALIIAAAVTVVGFAFAYGIRFKAGRWGQLCVFVTLITLFGGYLAKIYAWKTILGNEGILNSALIGLGIINQPLSYLLYSPGATALTLGHWLMPLAVLPILASLRGIEDLTIESARDLGASPRHIFLDIILPQSLPGLMAAFAFCFLIAAGDFVTPRMVGGPQTSMIGVFIQSQFSVRFNWPLGAAMSFMFLLSCLAALAVFRLLISRWRPR